MPDGLATATNALDALRLSFLAWLASEEDKRQAQYRVYREYYDGDHETQLTARQRKFLELKGGVEFRYNLCPIVVDALAEKLVVTGFDAGDQGTVLADWLAKGRLDGLQTVLHLAAVRDGDAYLMAGWDNAEKRPTFTYEPALSDGQGVHMVYSDQSNVPLCASKRWNVTSGPQAGNLRRLNLYYPDRIEKYQSSLSQNEGVWQPYYEPDQAAWPLPWLARDGSPLGIPVVHFKNKDQGYNFGTSELADVVPLQNALNKALVDLLAAADTTAFRIMWMVGDDPSNIQVAPGSWVYTVKPASGDHAAAMGVFEGASLDPLLKLKDGTALDIARVTRTPLSYFQVSGQTPAEGTQKQQEAGLVGKARNRQVSFGNAWEDALKLSRRLHNTFGSGSALDEGQTIETQWADPESRNEKEHLEALKIKADLGVTRSQIWQEMGYNAEQIAKMTAEAEAQADRQATREATLGDRLLKSFETGTSPNEVRQNAEGGGEETA